LCCGTRSQPVAALATKNGRNKNVSHKVINTSYSLTPLAEWEFEVKQLDTIIGRVTTTLEEEEKERTPEAEEGRAEQKRTKKS
jgi:hypothetical protein